MCGINGILRLDDDAPPVDRDELLRTRDAMVRRGPDGRGDWISPDGRVGLGHRRLAVIDLSEAGLQPMSRGDGRLHIVFNGEIYNYRELREELLRDGVAFRSHSDTEVILALYERHGVEMLGRLRGMFALGLWDSRDRSLLLARDAYGIKPLYVARGAGRLSFASQVKALRVGGVDVGPIDPGGLSGFLLWGSVPEPFTLHSGVRALPAGHYQRVVDGRVEPPRAHHRFSAGLGDRRREPSRVARALEESVRVHLVSDVPVGVFLSAGLDSSLIAALARRHVGEPLTTLTLRFEAYEGTPKDEAPLAAEVAAGLGSRHVERVVRPQEFLDLWPAALAAMDQPSIDGFNTFVVSRVAREQGFKVVLSGLGGDEIFGGYASFRDVPRWARWVARLRQLPGLGALWPAVAGRVAPDKPKLAGLLALGTSWAGAYFLRHALYLPQELPGLIGSRLAREGLEAYDAVADAAKYVDGAEDAWEAVHVMESTQFMRNQLLRDSDWASMAHGLELRVPLVDPLLRAELARADFEPARGAGKAAAVRLAAPELPEWLWTRPKTGFSMPVMAWLDAQVDAHASEGLSSRRLALRVLREFGVPLDARETSGADVA